MVPEDDTIVLADDPGIGPPGFVTEELITDDGEIPSPPLPLFDN